MRTWGILIVLATGGCLGQIIPAHDAPKPAPAPDPAPAGDDGGAAPDPGPAPPPAAGMDGGVLGAASTTVTVESESATLTAPMTIAADPNASGQQYIMTPAAAVGGKAVLTVQVGADADYTVWGRVMAPTDTANSFHFSVDADLIDNDGSDGSSTIWDLPVTTTWMWTKLNMRNTATTGIDITVHLTAGSHMLYLNEREALSAIDQLVVTADPAYVPN